MLRFLWVISGGLLVKAGCRDSDDIRLQVVTGIVQECVEGEKQLPSLETGHQTLGVTQKKFSVVGARVKKHF